MVLCRAVWFFPLRLDSPLYVDVAFSQAVPDYLEGLLLVLPAETLPQRVVVRTGRERDGTGRERRFWEDAVLVYRRGGRRRTVPWRTGDGVMPICDSEAVFAAATGWYPEYLSFYTQL